MQNESNTTHAQSKFLSLTIGKEKLKKLKELRILLVGVGGIGCQVLKNLSKFPIRKLTVIDLDIIQISNLNRQFYFRKQHISQPKAKVAAQELLKIAPSMNIQAIQGSIYDQKFDNFKFYSEFDIIISALDSIKSRQHLAKNATKYGKVLIDAGTSGFNGQSYTSVRFRTSCHNCFSSNMEENYAVCSIRTRPQKSIHCAIYSKHFYEWFFGNEGDVNLYQQVKKVKKKIFSQLPASKLFLVKQLAVQLFNYLFYQQILALKESYKDNVSSFQQLNPITYNDAFSIQNRKQKEKQTSQIDNDAVLNDKISTLDVYSHHFVSSFSNLVYRKLSNGTIPTFYDKDDDDCSMFVCCFTNIRVYNFKNSKNDKLSFLSLHETKRLIGKLIPAIASTNSIAAALQISQMVNSLLSIEGSNKYITISPFINEKITSSLISLPNPLCTVCSPKNLYFQIECNLQKTTFEQFQQYALKKCFSFKRDVYCNNLILIKNINAAKTSANKNKQINFKKELIIENTITLTFLPLSKVSDLKVEIVLVDTKDQDKSDKFRILNEEKVLQSIFMYQQRKVCQIKQRQSYIILENENKAQQNEKNLLQDEKIPSEKLQFC